METKLENNKRIVREFYELAFNERRPEEAVEKYMGSYYRQHNLKRATELNLLLALSITLRKLSQIYTWILNDSLQKAISLLFITTVRVMRGIPVWPLWIFFDLKMAKLSSIGM